MGISLEWYHAFAYVFPDGIWPYISLLYQLSLIVAGVGVATTLSYLAIRKRIIRLLGLATTTAGLLAYFFTFFVEFMIRQLPP